MLKKLFIFDTNQTTDWYKVIFWWELRRIFFNFLLLLFIAFFCLIIFIKYNSDPRFSFMYVIGAGYFLLWANIAYTLSWILHLIFRLFDTAFFKFLISAMFIGILLITFISASIPSISFLFFDEITAAHNSSNDPVINDLSGAYKFKEESLSKMKMPDNIAQSSRIWISNNNFLVEQFPIYRNSNSLTNYRLIKGSGSWQYKKNGSGLVIELNFENISDAESFEKLEPYKTQLYSDDSQKPELYLKVGESDKLILELITN